MDKFGMGYEMDWFGDNNPMGQIGHDFDLDKKDWTPYLGHI